MTTATANRAGRIHRTGVAVAIVSELASLTLAWDTMDFLLPIGRFGGLLWMLAIAATLPASRRQWRDRHGIVRDADQTPAS